MIGARYALAYRMLGVAVVVVPLVGVAWEIHRRDWPSVATFVILAIGAVIVTRLDTRRRRV